MEKTNKKKILSWINFILSTAIFLFALCVFIVAFAAHSRNSRAEFFGYSFAIVVTNSMYPEINAGDLIIVKSCDITDMKEGQNAVFMGLSGAFKDKSIVHQVVAIYDVIDETSGEKSGICLETWGINNKDGNDPKFDDDYVYADNFIGREVFHSTSLGRIMVFLKNPLNWIYLVIIFLAIYFAVKQSIKIFKYIKKKQKEKNE